MFKIAKNKLITRFISQTVLSAFLFTTMTMPYAQAVSVSHHKTSTSEKEQSVGASAGLSKDFGHRIKSAGEYQQFVALYVKKLEEFRKNLSGAQADKVLEMIQLIQYGLKFSPLLRTESAEYVIVRVQGQGQDVTFVMQGEIVPPQQVSKNNLESKQHTLRPKSMEDSLKAANLVTPISNPQITNISDLQGQEFTNAWKMPDEEFKARMSSILPENVRIEKAKDKDYWVFVPNFVPNKDVTSSQSGSFENQGPFSEYSDASSQLDEIAGSAVNHILNVFEEMAKYGNVVVNYAELNYYPYGIKKNLYNELEEFIKQELRPSFSTMLLDLKKSGYLLVIKNGVLMIEKIIGPGGMKKMLSKLLNKKKEEKKEKKDKKENKKNQKQDVEYANNNNNNNNNNNFNSQQIENNSSEIQKDTQTGLNNRSDLRFDFTNTNTNNKTERKNSQFQMYAIGNKLEQLQNNNNNNASPLDSGKQLRHQVSIKQMLKQTSEKKPTNTADQVKTNESQVPSNIALETNKNNAINNNQKPDDIQQENTEQDPQLQTVDDLLDMLMEITPMPQVKDNKSQFQSDTAQQTEKNNTISNNQKQDREQTQASINDLFKEFGIEPEPNEQIQNNQLSLSGSNITQQGNTSKSQVPSAIALKTNENNAKNNNQEQDDLQLKKDEKSIRNDEYQKNRRLLLDDMDKEIEGIGITNESRDPSENVTAMTNNNNWQQDSVNLLLTDITNHEVTSKKRDENNNNRQQNDKQQKKEAPSVDSTSRSKLKNPSTPRKNKQRRLFSIFSLLSKKEESRDQSDTTQKTQKNSAIRRNNENNNNNFTTLQESDVQQEEYPNVDLGSIPAVLNAINGGEEKDGTPKKKKLRTVFSIFGISKKSDTMDDIINDVDQYNKLLPSNTLTSADEKGNLIPGNDTASIEDENNNNNTRQQDNVTRENSSSRLPSPTKQAIKTTARNLKKLLSKNKIQIQEEQFSLLESESESGSGSELELEKEHQVKTDEFQFRSDIAQKTEKNSMTNTENNNNNNQKQNDMQQNEQEKTSITKQGSSKNKKDEVFSLYNADVQSKMALKTNENSTLYKDDDDDDNDNNRKRKLSELERKIKENEKEIREFSIKVESEHKTMIYFGYTEILADHNMLNLKKIPLKKLFEKLKNRAENLIKNDKNKDYEHLPVIMENIINAQVELGEMLSPGYNSSLASLYQPFVAKYETESQRDKVELTTLQKDANNLKKMSQELLLQEEQEIKALEENYDNYNNWITYYEITHYMSSDEKATALLQNLQKTKKKYMYIWTHKNMLTHRDTFFLFYIEDANNNNNNDDKIIGVDVLYPEQKGTVRDLLLADRYPGAPGVLSVNTEIQKHETPQAFLSSLVKDGYEFVVNNEIVYIERGGKGAGKNFQSEIAPVSQAVKNTLYHSSIQPLEAVLLRIWRIAGQIHEVSSQEAVLYDLKIQMLAWEQDMRGIIGQAWERLKKLLEGGSELSYWLESKFPEMQEVAKAIGKAAPGGRLEQPLVVIVDLPKDPMSNKEAQRVREFVKTMSELKPLNVHVVVTGENIAQAVWLYDLDKVKGLFQLEDESPEEILKAIDLVSEMKGGKIQVLTPKVEKWQGENLKITAWSISILTGALSDNVEPAAISQVVAQMMVSRHVYETQQ